MTTFKCDLLAALNAANHVTVAGYELVNYEIETWDAPMDPDDDDDYERIIRLVTTDPEDGVFFVDLDKDDTLEIEVNEGGEAWLTTTDNDTVNLSLEMTRPLTMADVRVDHSSGDEQEANASDFDGLPGKVSPSSPPGLMKVR